MQLLQELLKPMLCHVVQGTYEAAQFSTFAGAQLSMNRAKKRQAMQKAAQARRAARDDALARPGEPAPTGSAIVSFQDVLAGANCNLTQQRALLKALFDARNRGLRFKCKDGFKAYISAMEHAKRDPVWPCNPANLAEQSAAASQAASREEQLQEVAIGEDAQVAAQAGQATNAASAPHASDAALPVVPSATQAPVRQPGAEAASSFEILNPESV